MHPMASILALVFFRNDCSIYVKYKSKRNLGPPLAFHNIWAKDMLKFAKEEKRAPLNKRVAIIGGGPAGLIAAYELLKSDGIEIDILEASDRVGGRVLTVGKTLMFMCLMD